MRDPTGCHLAAVYSLKEVLGESSGSYLAVVRLWVANRLGKDACCLPASRVEGCIHLIDSGYSWLA